MALTWNVTKIANHTDTTTLRYEDGTPVPGDGGDERWHPITETLVWGAMFCGYQGITADNVAQVYARLVLWQQVFGPMVYLNHEPYYITPADVLRHVGLSTNATRKTDKEFMAGITAAVQRDTFDRISDVGPAPRTKKVDA